MYVFLALLIGLVFVIEPQTVWRIRHLFDADDAAPTMLSFKLIRACGVVLAVTALLAFVVPTLMQVYKYPTVTVEYLIPGEGPVPTFAMGTENGPTYRAVVYHDGNMESRAELASDADEIGGYNYKNNYLMTLDPAKSYSDGFLLEDGNYLFVCLDAEKGSPTAGIYTPSMDLVAIKSLSAEGMGLGGGYRGYRTYFIDDKLHCLVGKAPHPMEYYYFVYDVDGEKIERLDLITLKNRLPNDTWHITDWRVYK